MWDYLDTDTLSGWKRFRPHPHPYPEPEIDRGTAALIAHARGELSFEDLVEEVVREALEGMDPHPDITDLEPVPGRIKVDPSIPRGPLGRMSIHPHPETDAEYRAKRIDFCKAERWVNVGLSSTDLRLLVWEAGEGTDLKPVTYGDPPEGAWIDPMEGIPRTGLVPRGLNARPHRAKTNRLV